MRDAAADEREPLQALFAHQRRAESAVVPPFAATLAAGRLAQRRRMARRALWLYATASAAALVVVAAVMLRGWFTTTPVIAWSAPLGVELSAVSWTAPTDFLLATPDVQALSGVPQMLQVRDFRPAQIAPANDTND